MTTVTRPPTVSACLSVVITPAGVGNIYAVSGAADGFDVTHIAQTLTHGVVVEAQAHLNKASRNRRWLTSLQRAARRPKPRTSIALALAVTVDGKGLRTNVAATGNGDPYVTASRLLDNLSAAMEAKLHHLERTGSRVKVGQADD